MWGRRGAHTEAALAERSKRREVRRARLLALAQALAPDLRDVVFVIGLAALGYGLWLERPAAAFIVVGAVLIGVALRRAAKATENGRKPGGRS